MKKTVNVIPLLVIFSIFSFSCILNAENLNTQEDEKVSLNEAKTKMMKEYGDRLATSARQQEEYDRRLAEEKRLQAEAEKIQEAQKAIQEEARKQNNESARQMEETKAFRDDQRLILQRLLKQSEKTEEQQKRLDGLLSVWEKQQKQYQAYLDSLEKK
jgi:hypothetical protein